MENNGKKKSRFSTYTGGEDYGTNKMFRMWKRSK